MKRRQTSGQKRKVSSKDEELSLDFRAQDITGNVHQLIDTAKQEREKSGKVLRKVNLSDNPNLQRLEGLPEVAPKLSWLNVSNCKLSSHSLTDVRELAELSVFNAGNNVIKQIPAGALNNCNWLKALILNQNKIKKLEHMGHLRDLNTLVLSNNKIEIVQPDALEHLTKLAKLSIAHNRLQTFPPVSHLEGLQELRLNDNQIRVIPDEIVKLRHLRMVDVGRNQLKDFASLEPLQELRGLRHVVIQGNPLTQDDKLTQSYASECSSVEGRNALSGTEADDLMAKHGTPYRDLIRRMFPNVQMVDNVRVKGNPRGKRSRNTSSSGGKERKPMDSSADMGDTKEPSPGIRKETKKLKKNDDQSQQLYPHSSNGSSCTVDSTEETKQTEAASIEVSSVGDPGKLFKSSTDEKNKKTKRKEKSKDHVEEKRLNTNVKTQYSPKEIIRVNQSTHASTKTTTESHSTIAAAIEKHFAAPTGALSLSTSGWDD